MFLNLFIVIYIHVGVNNIIKKHLKCKMFIHAYVHNLDRNYY